MLLDDYYQQTLHNPPTLSSRCRNQAQVGQLEIEGQDGEAGVGVAGDPDAADGSTQTIEEPKWTS